MRYLALALAFCFFTMPAADAADRQKPLELQSSAFAPNGSIPPQYTCEGDDISPPLSWTNVPEGTQSFALIVDDPDAPNPAAPKKTWVHWVIYNLPPSTTSLAEAVSDLPKTSQGLNDWEAQGWRGPCPPIGRHHYSFKLYALRSTFSLSTPLDKHQLEEAMAGRVLAEADLIGTFEHSKR